MPPLLRLRDSLPGRLSLTYQFASYQFASNGARYARLVKCVFRRYLDRRNRVAFSFFLASRFEKNLISKHVAETRNICEITILTVGQKPPKPQIDAISISRIILIFLTLTYFNIFYNRVNITARDTILFHLCYCVCDYLDSSTFIMNIPVCPIFLQKPRVIHQRVMCVSHFREPLKLYRFTVTRKFIAAGIITQISLRLNMSLRSVINTAHALKVTFTPRNLLI